MCGVTAVVGPGAAEAAIDVMVESLHHRGPDDRGSYADPQRRAVLGHDRLSILDLSHAGHQPVASPDGRFVMVWNGELYNYRELRTELRGHTFTSECDTEVALAAWTEWGPACLHRFIGMFAFVLWDTATGEATFGRDRFGVKPLYVSQASDGTLYAASEIKALHAAGVPRRPDRSTWATFLATGRHELADRTFWEGIRPVPAGCLLRWRAGHLATEQWYDLAAAVGDHEDDRSDAEVADEWLGLALESVALRFRSDVPVGINVSGGVDSSFLLAAVRAVQGAESEVEAYTFVTGDPAYDELPWVQQLLAHTSHPSVVVSLAAEDVPALALDVARYQDEPFGGLPTLAYARLFEAARERGTIVLLDGQGLDEQWGGYDYYRTAAAGGEVPVVQGGGGATRAGSLLSGAEGLVLPSAPPAPGDDVRSLQLRDLTSTKIPRALRYNDRVSMRSSCELREPFLDHRLVELALRQPVSRKVDEVTGKVFLRKMLADRLPGRLVEAPKRPLQTPQREWLRGPLARWAEEMIETGLEGVGADLLDPTSVREDWQSFRVGEGGNSYFVWQWVSLGLTTTLLRDP